MSKILFLVSPTINSFVDPRKGTTGNKIDCAVHHFTNAVVSNAEIVGVAGIAGCFGAAAVKSKMANNPALKELMTSSGKFFKKAVEIYKATPAPVKAVAGALIGLSLLVRSYNAGKIEQKYLDRAQFVDHTFNLDDEGPNSAPKPVKPTVKK